MVALDALLNKGALTAIHFPGSKHHAQYDHSSGFCIFNDFAIAADIATKDYGLRVAILDIDAHHGDGVEEAFFTSDRVMTVSFHKFGDYFPGTGSLCDIGAGPGKYYSVNFPLNEGVDDFTFE